VAALTAGTRGSGEIVPEAATPAGDRLSALGLATYFAVGTAFGLVLTKTEAVSWFRIQEMFRFQSFHMYGILGSAVLVAALSLVAIRRLNITTLRGEPIDVPPRRMTPWGTRYWAGGSLFGLGWALTGACPGPLFALVGGGVTVMILAVIAALAGTWVYGYLRPRLPH
jgi:uncharacterized membrane protein YedE/YeeE